MREAGPDDLTIAFNRCGESLPGKPPKTRVTDFWRFFSPSLQSFPDFQSRNPPCSPLTMKLGGIYAKALFMPAPTTRSAPSAPSPRKNPHLAIPPSAPPRTLPCSHPTRTQTREPRLGPQVKSNQPYPQLNNWVCSIEKPTSPGARPPMRGGGVRSRPRHHRRRSPLSLGGALYRKHRKHAPPENFWRPQVTETTAPWRLLAKNSSNPGCGVSGPLSTPRPRFPVIPPFLVYLTRSLLSGPVRLE